MRYYKNISLSVKTFHGVTFKPGEVKEVKDFINDDHMIVVEPKPSESKPPKSVPQVADNPPAKSNKKPEKEDTNNGSDSN